MYEKIEEFAEENFCIKISQQENHRHFVQVRNFERQNVEIQIVDFENVESLSNLI
jgi:hypothetical protein